MARPRKQGLDYYPVATTEFNNEKINILLRRHKSDGYAVVKYLTTAIYTKGYFLHFDEMARENVFDRFPWIMGEQLDAILDDCLRWGIFDEELYRAEGVLSSAHIQEVYFFATDWRIRNDKELEYLLVKLPKAKRPASIETPQKVRKNDSDTNVVSISKTTDSEHNTKSLGVSQQQKKRNGKEKEIKPNKNKKKESKNNLSPKLACEHARGAIGGAPKNIFEEGHDGVAELGTSAKTAKEKNAPSAVNNAQYAVEKAKRENNYFYLPIDTLIEQSLASRTWVEAICMNNHLTFDELRTLLDKFRLTYIEQMRPETNTKGAFFGHFSNWLKYHLEAKRREEQNDIIMARRNAAIDSRFEQQRNEPHRLECDKRYVPNLNIIKFDANDPAQPRFPRTQPD